MLPSCASSTPALLYSCSTEPPPVPMHQPTMIAPPTTVYAAQPAGPGCCCVPATASCSVHAARGFAIAGIVIHVIALLMWGIFLPTVWISSLIAFIMGGVQLCAFNQCAYICAAIFSLIGCGLDVIATFSVLVTILLAIPHAIGAICFLLGAIFSLVAACNWNESGALDVKAPIVAVPQVHVPNPTIQITTEKWEPPPPYSGEV